MRLSNLLPLLPTTAIFGAKKKKRERKETGNWENDTLSDREVKDFKRQMCYTEVASAEVSVPASFGSQQLATAAAATSSETKKLGGSASAAPKGLVTKIHSFASLLPSGKGGPPQRQPAAGSKVAVS